MVCGCSIFERRYSNLYPTENINDIQHFRFDLGCHTIEDKKKSANIDRETAISQLLNEKLAEDNLCSNGYSIIEKQVFRHMDISIYGKCLK